MLGLRVVAVGACVLALAVEGSIKQSKRGGALCAQANIFERVVRIVRVCFFRSILERL
jgi:hypothetical protein